MRIGFIGAGNIGGTLATLFARAGHEVALSNSRGPETLSGLVATIGAQAQAMTAEDAAAFAEVVVTVPFKAFDAVPAGPLSGKVVIDTNNYYPGRDGRVAGIEDGTTTSSEMLAKHLGDARVVKAFNAIQYSHLRDAGRPAGAGRIGIPISGDDEDAKRVVAALIDEIGFDAVDMGPLAEGGRTHEPDSAVYGRDFPADVLRSHAAA